MGPSKYVFSKKYDHHYSFDVLDDEGKFLWKESFLTIPEAQATIPEGMIIDWGECAKLVDLNQTKTKINRRKAEKALGFDFNESEYANDYGESEEV